MPWSRSVAALRLRARFKPMSCRWVAMLVGRPSKWTASSGRPAGVDDVEPASNHQAQHHFMDGLASRADARRQQEPDWVRRSIGDASTRRTFRPSSRANHQNASGGDDDARRVGSAGLIGRRVPATWCRRQPTNLAWCDAAALLAPPPGAISWRDVAVAGVGVGVGVGRRPLRTGLPEHAADHVAIEPRAAGPVLPRNAWTGRRAHGRNASRRRRRVVNSGARIAQRLESWRPPGAIEWRAMRRLLARRPGPHQ